MRKVQLMFLCVRDRVTYPRRLGIATWNDALRDASCVLTTDKGQCIDDSFHNADLQLWHACTACNGYLSPSAEQLKNRHAFILGIFICCQLWLLCM